MAFAAPREIWIHPRNPSAPRCLPVAPNLHTDWAFLPRFEWATIDRFGEAVAILCAVAQWARQMGGLASETAVLLVVVGSRDDLEKWFRQIPQYSGDHCKQVYH